MDSEQLEEILSQIKRVEDERSKRRVTDQESHLDAMDREIAHAAQLHLISEESSLNELAEVLLKGAVLSAGNPT